MSIDWCIEKYVFMETTSFLITHTLKVGFKMFLGVVPTVANWSAKGDEFSLILDQNPLVDFVELPEEHQDLLYSNIICGVVRGALEMVIITCPVGCQTLPVDESYLISSKKT